MATWTYATKNTTNWTDIAKDVGALTFAQLPMSLLEDKVFQEAILDDGTKLEDVTFDTPVSPALRLRFIDNLWSYISKN